MDINNNTNISSQVISSISKLSPTNANRAFEASKKENEETLDIKDEDIKLMDSPKKPSIDVEDIQKYANYMGENLSIDDINYGLMYGRSVIADYSV